MTEEIKKGVRDFGQVTRLVYVTRRLAVTYPSRCRRRPRSLPGSVSDDGGRRRHHHQPGATRNRVAGPDEHGREPFPTDGPARARARRAPLREGHGHGHGHGYGTATVTARLRHGHSHGTFTAQSRHGHGFVTVTARSRPRPRHSYATTHGRTAPPPPPPRARSGAFRSRHGTRPAGGSGREGSSCGRSTYGPGELRKRCGRHMRGPGRAVWPLRAKDGSTKGHPVTARPRSRHGYGTVIFHRAQRRIRERTPSRPNRTRDSDARSGRIVPNAQPPAGRGECVGRLVGARAR